MPSLVSNPVHSVSGCVLAGGRGTRFEGADKGLIKLGNQTLVEHSLRRLEPQVEEVIVNANRHLKTYRSICPKVFVDPLANYPGPLAGFLGAMRHANFEDIVCVPCDSPFFPRDLVTQLWQAREQQHADVSVAVADGRPQPVFALIRRSLEQSLVSFLDSGERKIMAWLNSLNLARVDFPDPQAFANINTDAELRQAQVHSQR